MKMKNFHTIILELVISFNKYLRSTYYFLFIRHGSSLRANSQVSILKKRTGQSIVEYFLLFTIIIALTVIGISRLFPRIQESFTTIQSAAIEGIIHADIDGSEGGDGGGGGGGDDGGDDCEDDCGDDDGDEPKLE
ncbi:hypothetical protein ACFL2J_00225 [Candidatus Omnitrophota bacterium]